VAQVQAPVLPKKTKKQKTKQVSRGKTSQVGLPIMQICLVETSRAETSKNEGEI
jgi:hypothetical protein